MCLTRYVDYAEELEPLLAASISVASVSLEPDAAFKTAAQFRFQGAVRHRLAQQRDREASRRSWWQFGLPTWTPLNENKVRLGFVIFQKERLPLKDSVGVDND